ncbi:MAG: hypothetical protein WCY46_03910 [Tissierellaceae bacterium]
MKFRIKLLALLMILMLTLAQIAGCTSEEEPPKEDIDVERNVILPSEKIDISDYTLLDFITMDFNEDGYEETIALYTLAERLPSGEIAWDDGQNWALVVHGEYEDFILFNEYVQLGALGFFAYFQNDDFVISAIHSGTANLTLYEYKYENESFIEKVRFAAEGDINMFHHLPFNYDKISD